MMGVIDKDYECIRSDLGLGLWINNTGGVTVELSVLGLRDTDSTVTLTAEAAKDLSKTILENLENKQLTR